MVEQHSPQTLWDFALGLYARPGVAAACLRLQDEYRANVCLLIAMCWLDENGQLLDDAEFASLQFHIRPWTTQVVEPLRHVRRLLKAPLESLSLNETQEQLRNTVKQAELLAEKKLLEEIESWVGENLLASENKTSNRNLESYNHELNAPPDLVAALCRP